MENLEQLEHFVNIGLALARALLQALIELQDLCDRTHLLADLLLGELLDA